MFYVNVLIDVRWGQESSEGTLSNIHQQHKPNVSTNRESRPAPLRSPPSSNRGWPLDSRPRPGLSWTVLLMLFSHMTPVFLQRNIFYIQCVALDVIRKYQEVPIMCSKSQKCHINGRSSSLLLKKHKKFTDYQNGWLWALKINESLHPSSYHRVFFTMEMSCELFKSQKNQFFLKIVCWSWKYPVFHIN